MCDFMTKSLSNLQPVCLPLQELSSYHKPRQNPTYYHFRGRPVKITHLSPLGCLNPDVSQPILSGSGSGFGDDNDGNNGSGSNNRGGGGGGGGSDNADDRSKGPIDPIGLFSNGWRDRVSAVPEFPFKVLMEELVGVSACVPGDMASPPAFSLKCATLIAIGVTCAAFGFAAGVVGTGLSNGLINLWKKPNKAPPTLLNAMTWAAHMFLRSDLRCQTWWNGVKYVMGKVLQNPSPPPAVGWMRLKNGIGRLSLVLLARLTGSQKVEEKKSLIQEMVTSTDERWSKWGWFSRLCVAFSFELLQEGTGEFIVK